MVELFLDLLKAEVEREGFGIDDAGAAPGEDDEGALADEMLDDLMGGVWINAGGFGKSADGGEGVVCFDLARCERAVDGLDDLLVSRAGGGDVDLEGEVAHAELECLRLVL